MDEKRIMEVLRRASDQVDAPAPDVDTVLRRGKRHKLWSTAALAFVIALMSVGLALPLTGLVDLGRSDPPASGTSVVEISCSNGVATPSSPAVTAREDGVHVTMIADKSITALVSTRGTIDLPAGRTELILPVAPGEQVVAGCLVDGDRVVNVEVTDPNEAYVDPSLPCSNTIGAGTGDPDPIGRAEEDPAGLLKSYAAAEVVGFGLKGTDVFTRIGYTESATDALVFVRRGGTAVAVAEVVAYDGMWHLAGSEICRDG